MRRPWQIWGTFLACLALVAAAVGWLSVRAWQADRAEVEARQLAALEENVRLALWRMDSLVAPFVASESVRPPSAFQLRPPNLVGQPQALQAEGNFAAGQNSPAADSSDPASRWAHVRLYFQFDQQCRLSSPQVWYSEFANDLGSSSSSSSSGDHEQSQLLERLRGMIDIEAVQVLLPPLEGISRERSVEPVVSETRSGGRVVAVDRGLRARSVETELASQQARAATEYNARVQMAFQGKGKIVADGRDVFTESPGDAADITPFRPLVLEGELFLLRRARVGLDEFVQGCWIDWPALAEELRGQIEDLLPGSSVILLRDQESDPARALAALPVSLVVPPQRGVSGNPASSVRLSLLMAWGAMLLAAVAVAALLGGVLSLSERRASFVSAVTHELRTPLTTFRMYSEMLSDGMVSGPEQQAQYLRTLRVEADRLTHLVENVLAYARLERGGLGNRLTAT
ncbi:MAG: sensor histidine kinase, partial [Planctomycetaceae bacterium]